MFLRQLVAIDADALQADARAKIEEEKQKRKRKRRNGSRPGSRGSSRGTGAGESREGTTAGSAGVSSKATYALKKQTMLIRERLRVARAMARPWIAALKRSGYSTVGTLLHMPWRSLAEPLGEAYPIKPQPGLPLPEIRAVQVGAACPPAKVAQGISSHVAHWLRSDASAQRMFHRRQHTFDPRFQKGALDQNAKTPAARQFDEQMRRERGLMSTSASAFDKQRKGELPLVPHERKAPRAAGPGASMQASRPSPQHSGSVGTTGQRARASVREELRAAGEHVRETFSREEAARKEAAQPGRLLVAPLHFDPEQARREGTARARAERRAERERAAREQAEHREQIERTERLGAEKGPRQHEVRHMTSAEKMDRFRAGAVVLDESMVGSKGRPAMPAPIGRSRRG